MGLFDVLKSVAESAQRYAESPDGQRMMERAAQAKAEKERRMQDRGLQCKINRLSGTDASAVCNGTIKNVGTHTYFNIEVEIVYKNRNGAVVDRKQEKIWDRIPPGESRPFNSFSSAFNVQSASASVKQYQVI